MSLEKKLFKILIIIAAIFGFVVLFHEYCYGVPIGSTGNKLDAEIDQLGHINLVYEHSGCLYFRFYDGSWSIPVKVPGSCETYNTRFNPKISSNSYGFLIFWVNKTMTQILCSNDLGNPTQIFTDSVGGPDTNRFDVAHNDNRIFIVAQTDMALKSKYYDGSWNGPETVIQDVSEPKYPMLGNDLLLTFSYQGKLWKSQYNQSWDVPELINAECCVNTGSVYNDKIAWIVWTNQWQFSDLYYMQIGHPAKLLLSSPEFFDCPYSSECPIPQVVETANGIVCVIFATGGDHSFIDMFVLENGFWSRESIAGDYANNPAAVVSGNDVHIIYSGHSWQLQHEILHFGDTPTPTATPDPTSTVTPTMTATAIPESTPTMTPSPEPSVCPTCAPCPDPQIPGQCGKGSGMALMIGLGACFIRRKLS